MTNHKTLFFLFLGLSAPYLSSNAQPYHLESPNGAVTTKIFFDEGMTFKVKLNGLPLMNSVRVNYEINSHPLVWDAISEPKQTQINTILKPAIPGRGAEISDHYNQLVFQFKNNFSIEFRAYNSGVAYRLVTNIPEEIVVSDEVFEITFTEHSKAWYPIEEHFFSSNERNYWHGTLDTLASGTLASLPALFSNSTGQKFIVMESALHDYAGMWLIKTEEGISASFPRYPNHVQNITDRQQKVITRKSYIAKTAGTRAFPWRILGVAQNDIDLLTNQLVYTLAEETAIETDWIKPGKVAWDWWNALNIRHVDFESGPNTQTYKHYIDFAAENGIEYIILDEGWYILGDLLHLNDEIDVKELIRYGKTKGVGVILWVVWRTLEEQFDKAMDAFAEWGAKGIKVDFMDRDDQWMVNYYERVAKAAAERHLLVDFHGAYKPAGLRRKYPNVITREGVLGLEYNKWSAQVTPTHNVTLPYVRMVPGPLDYTPGGLTNTQPGNFRISHFRPMVMGSRAHEVAKFVIYESPLQMLADTPTNYRDEQETTDFITQIPTVWHQVLPLAGKVGEYIVMAKRYEDRWFLGAMSNEEARSITINLDFLDSGNYSLNMIRDGKNTHHNAEDYVLETRKVKRTDTLTIAIAPSGGWAAIITKQ